MTVKHWEQIQSRELRLAGELHPKLGEHMGAFPPTGGLLLPYDPIKEARDRAHHALIAMAIRDAFLDGWDGGFDSHAHPAPEKEAR